MKTEALLQDNNQSKILDVENTKWPPIKLGAFLFLMTIMTSCSSLSRIFEPEKKIEFEKFSESDYIAQLNYQGDLFLEENKSSVIRLRNSEREYFDRIIDRLVNDNSKYLSAKEIEYELVLLSSKTPFYFVLPNGKLIISSGLIKKYLANENLLTVVLAKLVFISQNSIYLKQVSIPKGTVSLIEIMKIVDLPLEARSEINKWAYHMLYRSGFDGSAVLNWIQIQNKNILDFSMMHKDLNLISKEEYNFKNFIIKNENRRTIKLEKNSSKDFYLFKKGLVRNANVNSIRRTVN